MNEKSKYLEKNFRNIVFTHDIDAFKEVFKNCDINAIVEDSNNLNALSFPGMDCEQIQFLIDNGIDINGDCGNGLPAVAYQAYSVENLRFLIKNGADINLKLSTYPGSAIEYAELHHYITYISNLMECGANIDNISLKDVLYYSNNIDIVSVLKITKYKLSRGIQITDEMRELLLKIGKRFEFYRENFNKDNVEEFSNALNELYKIYNVEPVAHKVKFDMKSNIKEIILKNKKYIYSLIYGIFGCLGFICLFNWFVIVSFHEISKYPHRYPMCIALGMISLIVCIVTCILNVETLMKEKNRIKYILFESLFTLIVFILFFFIFGFIDEKI